MAGCILPEGQLGTGEHSETGFLLRKPTFPRGIMDSFCVTGYVGLGTGSVGLGPAVILLHHSSSPSAPWST